MPRRKKKLPEIGNPTPCGWMAHEVELLKEQFPRITQGDTYEYFRIFGNDLNYSIGRLAAVVFQLEHTGSIKQSREESYRLLARIICMSKWLNELSRIAAGRKKLEIPSVTELVKSEWVEKRNKKSKK
jgi:hypothetical protein